MKEKRIVDIVGYTVTDKVGDSTSTWDVATVFYDDGTVGTVPMDDGRKLAKDNNILMVETYAGSGYLSEKIRRHFEEYSQATEEVLEEQVEGVPEVSTAAAIYQEPVFSYDTLDAMLNLVNENKEESVVLGEEDLEKTDEVDNTDKVDFETIEEQEEIEDEKVGMFTRLRNSIQNIRTLRLVRKKEKMKEKITSLMDGEEKASKIESLKDRVLKINKVLNRSSRKKKEKKGIFSYISKKVVAGATAAAMVIGSIPVINKLVKPVYASTKDTITETGVDMDDFSNDQLLKQLQKEDSAYDDLLDKTTNTTQKAEMTKIGNYIDYFNGTFASHYLESNHPGVRAALTFEEISALNLAYNDFSKEDIKAIFNGYELNSYDFTNYYKEATLQLMGAFVIETRDMPVELDQLLNTEEGKAFYQKYHELFMKCKETTGQEQINAVNSFYQELYKDYPISDEVREVGISHSESRDDIEAYKLAVTPMVAAAEMMFQNLAIDHTLSDKAIAYFNDLGLCEFAEDKFDKAEYILLAANEDKDNPTFEEFMEAKVSEQKEKDIYFVSDEARDLSQLDSFQEWVNGHFNIQDGSFVTSGSIIVGSYSTSSVTYHTETSTITTSDRDYAVGLVGEDAVRRAEEEVDKAFEEENEKLKAEGEAEAEKNRQEMQEEADKEAEEIRDEIKEEEEQLQEDIDKANDQIDENNKDQDSTNDNSVSEDDFHGNVDFDDEHSQDGVLDDSVSDITTDGSGADQDLPDSNETGEKFDNQAPEYTPNYDAMAQAAVDYMEANPVEDESTYVYTK